MAERGRGERVGERGREKEGEKEGEMERNGGMERREKENGEGGGQTRRKNVVTGCRRGKQKIG